MIVSSNPGTAKQTLRLLLLPLSKFSINFQMEFFRTCNAIVFISVKNEVNCNSTDFSEEDLHTGRTQEEADTKINVYVKHSHLNGFKNVVVETVDSNVVTQLLAHLSLLDLPYEIQVAFNSGKDRRVYKINNICSGITPE